MRNARGEVAILSSPFTLFAWVRIFPDNFFLVRLSGNFGFRTADLIDSENPQSEFTNRHVPIPKHSVAN